MQRRSFTASTNKLAYAQAFTAPASVRPDRPRRHRLGLGAKRRRRHLG